MSRGRYDETAAVEIKPIAMVDAREQRPVSRHRGPAAVVDVVRWSPECHSSPFLDDPLSLVQEIIMIRTSGDWGTSPNDSTKE